MIALCNSGLFETDEFGQLVVMDARGKRLMKYAQGMSGFAFLNEVGGSMMASKGSSDLIAYQLPHPEGLAMVPGKMLELRYNRPRQVLSLLGYSDSFTLKAYDAAWSKRMSNVLPPPADEWQNRPLVSTDFKRGTLATSQTSVPVDIDFHAVADSVVSLHIVHNGCPVNGTAGIRFAKASWKGVNTWQLDLVPGKNTLSLTVKDKKGRESIPYYLEIFCADDEMEPQTYFIGIGVSHYRDAKNNLVYASKDIRDISHYMSGLSHCTIDTFVNENALWSNLLGVKQKLAKLKPGDRVVVAFSGHGLLDKNLDLYLGLHSVNFQNPAQGGLKLEQLISLLDSTPACQKLLLLDACHSGEIDKEGKIQAVVTTIKPGAKGSQNLLVKSNKTVDAFEFMKARFEDAVNENGTVIISAAGGKEYALENDVYSNGIFTFALLQCLQKLQGDTDHDGKISIEELKQFLLTRVPEYSGGRQKPTMRRENAFNNWIF